MRGRPGPTEHAFGEELERLRYRHHLKQAAIFPHLDWSADRYSRLESGLRAPVFDDLPAIAHSLSNAGVTFTLQDVQRFLTAARQRIAQQRTYKDEHTDDEWSAMFQQIARDLGLMDAETAHALRPHLLDTRHLVPRDDWHKKMLAYVDNEPSPKLLVITGAPGVGKSSELSWLAMTLSRRGSPAPHIVLCDLRALDSTGTPDAALNLVFGTLFTELHAPLPQSTFTLDEQTTLLLGLLEQQHDRLFVIVDHAEWALLPAGALASWWERFLSRLLRASHRATFVLATRQWPGWYGDEPAFVREIVVPAFSDEDAMLLLRQLGLDGVPASSLLEIARRVGGIPRGLEWAAALATHPLAVDEWQDIFPPTSPPVEQQAQRQSATVTRLLAEPHLFGGSLGDDIAPVLSQIIERQRLSAEAQWLLDVLSCSPIPLSQTALVAICGEIGTRPLRELRRASLLVSYEQRVHVNALVASAIIRKLAPLERRKREETLIAAYEAWLDTGECEQREAGSIVYELVRLLLLHHRLLDAAQYLIHYGWLAFGLGYTRQLADLARTVLCQIDWQATPMQECGRLLLRSYLLPYASSTDKVTPQVRDFERILALATTEGVHVTPPTDIYVTRQLMVDRMSAGAFEQAEVMLDTCCLRLVPYALTDRDLQASLLEKRAILYGLWCEVVEEHGEQEEGRIRRQQAIAFYRQCCDLLTLGAPLSVLQQGIMKRRLARCLNDLGYHLNRIGQYEVAQQALTRCIELKEQGYVDPGSLAPSYDELAQTLAGFGQFRNALSLNERALHEVERLAQAGHKPSQEDIWPYRVNRGRLFLACGKADEAASLLHEAVDHNHIHPRRRMFYMFANQALTEIRQGLQASSDDHYQLDWRWIGRYRALASFDSLWWLSPSGPFTLDEEQTWRELQSSPTDQTQQRTQLQALVNQARQREVALALAEGREPQLCYPVIPMRDVEARLEALHQLREDIARDEPHMLVQHFYWDVIEEQCWFLAMLKATAERDGQAFLANNQLLHPAPTVDEMRYTLSRIAVVIRTGLRRQETRALAQYVNMLLQERLRDTSDMKIELDEPEMPFLAAPHEALATPLHRFSPQVVQQFLGEVLQACGFDGWQVMLDATAQSAHIEQGLQVLIIPEIGYSVTQIRSYLVHELGGHIARAVAGERSPLGLLGIGTKNNLTTEEGLALSLERRIADMQEVAYDELRLWSGTLATGMASGVLMYPQSFRGSLAFFEEFYLLYRLLRRIDASLEAAKERAHDLAVLRCLRTYRGVPDLTQVGVCSTKDAVYLRGYQMIERALAADEAMLDRLTVGVVAFEDIPALKELGLIAPVNPPAKVALDPDVEMHLQAIEQTISADKSE